MRKSIQKEIDGLKKLSTVNLKKELRQYKILLKLKSELFMFCTTLVCCIIPILFFRFSIITWSLVLLFHFFIVWKKANLIIDEKNILEIERVEIYMIIEEINLELKHREELINTI